ncbi:MAG TPA: histidinol dehydrogenase [Spirochaetota bacterium]|jgi:histidinol dehydrogenase|nr:MAG: Histidinol dehydrogenase [Spirochaetes bacterium ADurb.Bin133]HNZ28070.1 histidinol dehydrogenase [Spirochaetota bacterium]HPY87294.1 histidinol dehydrogenase [Spirochaetota bacterium]HQB61706.1 histidinol dehydrogenase [Spirochaetota bacterium]
MKFFECKSASLPKDLSQFLNEAAAREDREVENLISDITADILSSGFDALVRYTKSYDNFDLNGDNLRVSKEEIRALSGKIDPKLSESLDVAIARIRNFHNNQTQKSFSYTDEDNNKMGQNVVPIDSVAVYVPGGRALYPSTMYMTIVPALIAGVKRIVVVSPPRTFIESPEVAYLLETLGVNEVYRIGGAQAVLSLAYGIEGFIKPVDKIVGPGNIFVAKAKQSVSGKVAIDMIAGPSEICIIADTDRDEDIPLIAADILSQAEHDPLARPILLSSNRVFIDKIIKKTYEILQTLPKNLMENAEKSLNNRGIAVLTDNADASVELSNILAPEHLEIFSDEPYRLLKNVTNAGSVFLGRWTPESVGDYIGGPNHVLPTGGTSRFYSPLGVYDFQKRFSWIEFNKESLYKYKDNIATIARSEKLESHARSVEIRFENK